MIRWGLVCLCLLFSITHVYAGRSPLTVDLAQDYVDITTGFDGGYLSLFGVKEKGGQVAVVIRGPQKDVIVRKKSKIMGVWMNRQSMHYDNVPQFYDYALSDAEENVLNPPLRKEYGIGVEALKFSPEENGFNDSEKKEFQQALIRNKQSEGLFPVEPKKIIFLSDVFFKTVFQVPPNVPTGEYVIETFLIDGNKLLDKRETHVRVAQVGFSAGVYQFAHSYSLAYALIIVFIAVIAGWLSNAVRQKNK